MYVSTSLLSQTDSALGSRSVAFLLAMAEHSREQSLLAKYLAAFEILTFDSKSQARAFEFYAACFLAFHLHTTRQLLRCKLFGGEDFLMKNFLQWNLDLNDILHVLEFGTVQYKHGISLELKKTEDLRDVLIDFDESALRSLFE